MFEKWWSSKKITERKALSPADPWLLSLFGSTETAAGVEITPVTAMQCAPVNAAVTLIASTVGTLPAKVFERSEKGKEADPDHPAHALIHDDANPWQSASQLRTQLTTDSLLHGNGFAYINRVNGKPRELIRLDPAQTSILIDTRTGEPRYQVEDTAGRRFYDHREILHIPAFSLDGVTGVAPIHMAREAISLALVLEKHAAQLFANGARPSGILRFPKKLGAEAAKRIATAWHATHGGDNTGKTAIIEEDGDYKQMALNSVDAQFAEMRTFQIVEIARAFRVPPTLIFELGRATWANNEQLRQHFLQFTLLPWLRTWEAAYRRVLLMPDERATHTVEFVVDDLLRADTQTRAEAYSKFVSMRAMTPNEVRAKENLPAIAGGDELQNPYTTSGAQSD